MEKCEVFMWSTSTMEQFLLVPGSLLYSIITVVRDVLEHYYEVL